MTPDQADALRRDDNVRAIRYARGSSIEDNYPKVCVAADFGAFATAILRDRGTKKGQQYFCAPFNNDGRRCRENAQPRRFLPVDLDRIAPEKLADVRLWFTRFRGFGYSTASSTSEAPRERAVLELDREATRDECVRIGATLASSLLAEFGGAVQVDLTVFRSEQPVFTPLRGAEKVFYEGDVLPVDEWLAKAQPVREELPPARTPPQHRHHGDELERIRAALRFCGAADDYETWVTIGMEIHEGTGGSEQGFGLWAEWAAQSNKFDLAQSRAKWLTFHAGGGLGLGSLFRRARENGWREDGARKACSRRQNHRNGEDGPPPPAEVPPAVGLEDLWAYLPKHVYIYAPTGELWPKETVDSVLPPIPQGKKQVKASRYLDRTKAVHTMTWDPRRQPVIEGQLATDGGWAAKAGARTFNLYRPPAVLRGSPYEARPWRDQLYRLFPDTAPHIELYLAHRIQCPGEKVNHGLVLGGAQRIGKDAILEPVKVGVGHWNWAEVSPQVAMGQFTEFRRSVVVRISEAHDLGDFDRFAFYEGTKTLMAAPPDVVRINEKYRGPYYVPNVGGVIITTNHKTGGLYLSPDDCRHHCSWSNAAKEDVTPDEWAAYWAFLEAEGNGHVVAYLRGLDLSKFNPKAPPPQTEAWHAIVMAGIPADEADLICLLEAMNGKDKEARGAVTIAMLVDAASARGMLDLANELRDRRQAARIPHKLDRAGYEAFRNEGAKTGRWKIGGRDMMVYVPKCRTHRENAAAVKQLVDSERVAGDQKGSYLHATRGD